MVACTLFWIDIGFLWNANDTVVTITAH